MQTLLLVLALMLGTQARALAYEGHGIETLSPEQLKKFAPPALDSRLSAAVQSALDLRSPGGGMLSPDGKKLFFSWSVTGTWQVWRLDGPNRFPVQMTGGEDRTAIVGVVPDGKSIVVSRDHHGEENPGIYLQSAEGGRLVEVVHKLKVRAEFQFVTDDGQWLYYVANDVKPDSFYLYRYSLRDKSTERVFAQDGVWSVADYRNASELLLEKATGNLAREYYLYDVRAKALTPLFGQGETQEYSAQFAAQPGGLLVLTNKFSDFRRLYRWKGGQFMGLSPEMPKDVAGFAIDRARSRIYYEVNDRGYHKIEVLDARSFRPQRLTAFPRADLVLLGAVSRNGRFANFSVETGTAPRTSYVLDWSTRRLTQWVVPSVPEAELSAFVGPKLEYYPARDRTKIPMFVRRPKGCSAPDEKGKMSAGKLCPVVVHFHGGPESQTLPGFSATWQLFNDQGFVVVEPNVRGSDGYGRAWLDSDNGPKRLDVVTDIEDCATYVKTAWAVNGVAPRIGVMGWSYGGYSTLYAMTRFAGAYDAGVALVGMGSLKTFLKNTAPYRRKLRAAEYGDPEKDAEALDKLSPLSYLDKVKDPLLIIQGANDPRVPAGEAIQIFEAMRKRELAAELIIFGDEGHGASKRENKVFELGHALRFFEKHLAGAAAK
ncbi:MAG: S9 family peptidase [Deltaproteobacteria bacterium]|nr:S9 family peptidase [Deltaproteobacteria bacterium]